MLCPSTLILNTCDISPWWDKNGTGVFQQVTSMERVDRESEDIPEIEGHLRYVPYVYLAVPVDIGPEVRRR